MGTLSIGYVPYSQDLSHPADRRRIAFWAERSQVQINTTNLDSEKVIVLSNAANFYKWMKNNNQVIFLDLVDGYLGEKPCFLADFLRNIVKSLNGTSSLRWITYSRHLEYACKKAHGVIVASIEQKIDVEKYCGNIHVILDNHQEINVTDPVKRIAVTDNSILWEGFPYTFKHFVILNRQVDKLLSTHRIKLIIVSKRKFKKWGGYLRNQDLSKIILKLFPKSNKQINIIEWSIPMLIEYSRTASLAVIPVNTKDKFANLKPENKLLSMWALGIPTLTSPTLSYTRVLKEAELECCITQDSEWAEKIESLISNQVEREEIMRKAQDYLNSHHTEEILLKKWDKALLNWISS